ncbi:cycloartenol synthase-like isoform X3 [Phoenix dactylifera]|uniref:Cycloartenol synthase-like isoform X3 n=1 Tax=Phoenix dactylifera TaxID=42345 RepID=A0A8B9AHB4_PHODC|nr:cycloartenol synthase-like isoform X3 [Phoenix dactylifera]
MRLCVGSRHMGDGVLSRARPAAPPTPPVWSPSGQISTTTLLFQVLPPDPAMWRLKIAQGGSPWLKTTNNHVGRQVWEFDPNMGTAEEIAAVQKVRELFREHRFEMKHSADLLMRLQFAKDNPLEINLPNIKLEDHDDVTEEVVLTSVRRAISCYSTLQAHDGHWPGDFGGPMFLMPGLIIVLSVTGALNTVLSPEHQREIRRYLYNHQNKDGGWGLHIEGHSTMFGSALTYVSLRLLGEGPDDGDGAMQTARTWILDHGGATAITSWGKFWLSVLGVFEWYGNNPLPPEMWLLPYFLPVHPGRMWCHCRMVYLPMSYIYGKRFVGPITPTVLSLRKELYACPYQQIDWNRARNECAKEDLYYPHPLIQDIIWASLHKVVEPVLMHSPGSMLREKALHIVMQHIHYEDESTRYICIGPVNKGAFYYEQGSSSRYRTLYRCHTGAVSVQYGMGSFRCIECQDPSRISTSTKPVWCGARCTVRFGPVLNMLSCWIEDPNSEAFKLHLPRVYDYLWIAEDGMKMQGYNGSQLWDTAFTVQAIISTDLSEEYGPTLKRAHDYIKDSQVLEDCPGDLSFWHRHISKGGWTFCTADHGWPVSDCTAEGLMASVLLSKISPEIVGEPLCAGRIYDAVNVILSLMNRDGGFAAYELTRSYAWLEVSTCKCIFPCLQFLHGIFIFTYF